MASRGSLSAGVRDAKLVTWRLRDLDGIDVTLFPWNLYWDQRSVLLTLVRTQIARRHRRSVLGWAWNLIQPGSQALLLFAATRSALHVPATASALAGFGLFFAAYIIAQGMGEIVSRGPNLVAERPSWVKGSLFPLELLAPVAVGVSLYRIIPGGLIGVAAVTAGDGISAGVEALAAFAIGLVLAVIWGTMMGLGFAALGVYLRDAILAAPIITLAMIFISPLYVDSSDAGILGLAINLNPLTVSMDLALYGVGWIPSHGLYIGLSVAASFALLWGVALVFRRLAANFADYL